MFTRLEIANWKQYRSVDIQFHPRLTILTGANGSGKTTILNLLSRHFGWNFSELSTPAIDDKSGIFRFFTRWFKTPEESTTTKIGSLQYGNGNKAELHVPAANSAQYNVEIRGQQAIEGFNIPSHRAVFVYAPVEQISTRPRLRRDAFSLVSDSLRSRLQGGGGRLGNFHIKETLIAWAVFGYGNPAVQADPKQLENYKGFESVLRALLPPTLGFLEISIRGNEVVLVTNSGDFMLDAVSGGVSALIDLGWQIFTYGAEKGTSFCVLIDEVENHLHPSMQRRVLPSLLEAFPQAQFIVSTHSPLVVGSSEEASVYALRYAPDKRVLTHKLDLREKAKDAIEILREVLEVPTSLPVWVEERIDVIVRKYTGESLNAASFESLKVEMRAIGLNQYLPAVLPAIISGGIKNDKVE